MSNKPKVVVLCGSSRFIQIMAVAAWLLERDEGVITMWMHLLPYWYSNDPIHDHLADRSWSEHEGVAEKMDELRKRKIDLADEIFVVDLYGYVGESTQSEILYALAQTKTVRWYSSDRISATVNQLLLDHQQSVNT